MLIVFLRLYVLVVSLINTSISDRHNTSNNLRFMFSFCFFRTAGRSLSVLCIITAQCKTLTKPQIMFSARTNCLNIICCRYRSQRRAATRQQQRRRRRRRRHRHRLCPCLCLTLGQRKRRRCRCRSSSTSVGVVRIGESPTANT